MHAYRLEIQHMLMHIHIAQKHTTALLVWVHSGSYSCMNKQSEFNILSINISKITNVSHFSVMRINSVVWKVSPLSLACYQYFLNAIVSAMKFREWVHQVPKLLSRLASGAEEFSCVCVTAADDLLTDDVMRWDAVAVPLTAPRRK